jgi:hypothetical protein
MQTAPAIEPRANFGLAWLLLCFAFVAHVVDEALTDFLSYFNATVLALYGHFPWFPRLDMEFRTWLAALIVANVLLLLLTPLAYRNAEPLRPLAYFFAVIMLVNALGHTVATLRGQTVPSVHFSGPAPGFYSSPLLFAAAIYLLLRLRRSAKTLSG